MRKILYLALWVLATAVLIFILLDQPGSVVVNLRDWSIELPLWLGGLGFVLFFLAVLSIWKVLKFIVSIPARIRAQYHRNYERKQKKAIQEALANWLVEDWQACHQAFKSLANLNFMPKLSLLAATKAAHHQQQKNLELDYLDQALVLPNEKEQWLMDLFRVDLLLDQGAFEEARQLLDRLSVHHGKTVLVMKRQLRLQIANKNWHAALLLLIALRKTRELTLTEDKALSASLYRQLILQASEVSAAHLQQVWEDLPEVCTKDPEYLSLYVQGLIRHQQGTVAESSLRRALKASWNEALFVLYCQVIGTDPIKQMEYADLWFKQAPQTEKTLLAMGYLCANHQMLGRAKHYYQISLQVKPTQEAALALAAIHVQEKQYAEAIPLFQQACVLSR